MNLNTVYLPHFCRPCYHKKNLMDLILLLISHFVLIITFANTFTNCYVIRHNATYSTDAQLSKFHHNHHSHQTTVMPSKSISYELTVVHNPLTDHDHHSKHNQSKTNQLDKINQEQLDQLDQVKFSNELNKVHINPINVLESLNQIKQQQQLQSLKNQVFNPEKIEQQQQTSFDEQQQQSTKTDYSIKTDHSSIKTDHSSIKTDHSSIKKPDEQKNEMRDGFVVLTSAHNSKYPAPMLFSRNVYSGSSIQNDFYQKYHTTSVITTRPPVKEHHHDNQQNIVQVPEKIHQMQQINEEQQHQEHHQEQHQQQNLHDVKTSYVQNQQDVKNSYAQNYHSSNANNSLNSNENSFIPEDKPEEVKEFFLSNNEHKLFLPENKPQADKELFPINDEHKVFQPEDRPEEDKELFHASDDHKTLSNEFNSVNDEKDSNSKTFFELFGSEVTSYKLKSNSTNSLDNSSFNNKTLFNNNINLQNISTNTPIFDLTAEDSRFRPFISNSNTDSLINNDNDQQNLKLKSHGTRPGQPLTSYELFKEYPLINNSNIIINQFHSPTSNWTRPHHITSFSDKNQTKFFTIDPITKKPTTISPFTILQPLLADYSAFNSLPFKPTIITEFANDFLTNISPNISNYNNNNDFIKNDLDNSDSNYVTFFNYSSTSSLPSTTTFKTTTTTTSTQSPIETLDRNQFDIPLSPVWNSVADQLISSTTTQAPFHIFNLPPTSNSFVHVSASDLITLKRNYSSSNNPSPPKFKPQSVTATSSPSLRPNSSAHIHLTSSNNVPHHFHHSLRLPASSTPSSVLYSATQNPILNGNNSASFLMPITTTSTTTPSTITPEVYKYIPGIATRQPPLNNFVDHNYTTYTNNHNFDETINYNSPLRLATNPKVIQPLTLFLMSYLASKSSIGANLITRNDQPSNSSSTGNGSLVDWLRLSGRRNRKRSKQSTRSNKQVNRQQKQRSTNSNTNNNKANLNSLPLALSNFQLRPITIDDILLSNQISNQLTGTSTLLQNPFLSSLNSYSNPFLYSSTRPPILGTTSSRMPQMIFETKRHRPSSNYIPDELLNENENGFTADDYDEEIKALFENPLNDPRLNSKLLNNDSKQTVTSNKNSGSSSSTYRTHRNSLQSNSLNSRNSRTPPDSSGSSDSNINSPTSHSLKDNDQNRHTTNTPAPRCDKFTNYICVEDFEYPESAILEEIDRKKSIFQLLYSEVKSEASQVDGLTRAQEQELSWDNQFGSNSYLNDNSNESTFSPSNNSPNRNSYLTMDDDLLHEKTPFKFNPLVKDSSFNAKASGFICSSEILYGRPKLAKNTKNQWKVIVNAGQYTQSLRMEKCLKPDKECSLVQTAAAAIGATSTCAQIHSIHRLVVFEKGRGFYIDTFKIPTGCTCYVKPSKKSSSLSSSEFDSEELSSNNYKKVNRKRIDNLSAFKDKNEIDSQTSNKLQQGLAASIFNQPFILNDLNNLQNNKLQNLFPASTFGQRVSNLNNMNTLSSNKIQPAIELRPLYLKNGKTLLASLLPLAANNNNNNLPKFNQSLIEKLSVSGKLNPALAEQQQRELNQLILDIVKMNSNSPKILNLDRSNVINLEDLVRSQLSLAQVIPSNLLEQYNSALFNLNRQNEVIKTINRRKNTSPSKNNGNNLLNALTNNQKIGLLYLDDSISDKNSKAKIKALPVVKVLPISPLNNQQVYGQRFVDKRKSGIAQLLIGNKNGNYSNVLTNNLLGNKNSLTLRENGFNLETPISALKIINPENLITQSPIQNDSKEKSAKDKETSDESDDEDEEKVIDEIDAGNLLGNMEDQEDKEDGEMNYAEMNAESNHGESSEQDNNNSKNDQNNEHLTNELNEDDKEPNHNSSNEANDHDQLNDPHNLKDQHLTSNHLDSNNSSLFTFDNISNGPKLRLKPKFNGINSTSYVSVSGFASASSKNRVTTESNPINNNSKSKLNNHEQYYTEQLEYKNDALQNENNNQLTDFKHSIASATNSISTSTTPSYLTGDNNSNEWSGSLSSSTIFTPYRTLKRKYNATTISPTYSTINYQTNKRKQNDDILMFGYKKQGSKNNQLLTTTNSAEQQTSNQNIDRLAIEETENRFRNQTNELVNTNKGTVNDRSVSDILNEKVINFHYHPILDFINRKE